MIDNDDTEAGRNNTQTDTYPDSPVIESTQTTSLIAMDELSDDTAPPTPRFMQDRSSYRNMKWAPMPIRRVGKAIFQWAKGPSPPKIQAIKPLFPSIQEAPIRLLDKYAPRRLHRFALLTGLYFFWIFAFVMVMHQSTNATEIEDWGAPSDIGCGNTYWVAGNGCGLNGNDCRPFSGSGFAFRCPANCITYWALNPRAVGAEEVIYKPMVIGGRSGDDESAIYRGDSFICGSAIHAGIISNANGGCGVVSLVGASSNYTSSQRHGIESVGFDGTFPSSFTFLPDITCTAKDARWSLLAISVSFTACLSLFTTSAGVFFFSIFIGLFAHVGLASDPPGHTSIAGLVSDILGKFLPAAFCAVIMYRYMGVRRTLTGLTAQVEKTVLWLGLCWVGALSNYTLEWIPIQRLNGHDLEQQPGAKAALAVIVIVLFVIIVKQIFYFRREGRLIRYLGIYGIFILAILISLSLPGLSLRIHHYILALLLLPGTSMQTRPALVYQGILVGLFINGIARWGFDSVLQTPDALQGDAQHNSLLPVIEPPVIAPGNASTISFSWPSLSDPFDGISVLVNDVERFRGYTDEEYVHGNKFEWEKQPGVVAPEYFRFAYMQGAQTWDYTRAGIWNADGSWTEMGPGPSRVKSRSVDRRDLIRP